jgi:nucleotide-binding universal stress UspA family protein
MAGRPTVLVPIRVLEESLPRGIPDLLAHAHVVLLGYHVIPEQTAPGQARMQFEERANQQLDDVQSLLEDAGATVERRLVFTHHAQTTIDRLIYEHDCLAVLVPNATTTPERVLVPVRGAVGADRLARLVGGLFAETDVDVTLYHVARKDETDEDADLLLTGIADSLEAAGIDEDRITREVARDVGDPVEAISDLAETYEVVVMGETDPSIETFVFGMPSQAVADRFLDPVLVVQRERPESSAEEDDDEADAT